MPHQLSKELPPQLDPEQFYHQALLATIDHLKANWFEANVGIVAATLIEDGQLYTSTSLYLPEQEKWLHAEAAVIDLLKSNQAGILTFKAP